MEREYNWKAILYGAVPVSAVIAFIFFLNMSTGMKWLFLIVGMVAASVTTYYLDRKKHNIFTSAFIVLIAALIVYGLKNLGLF